MCNLERQTLLTRRNVTLAVEPSLNCLDGISPQNTINHRDSDDRNFVHGWLRSIEHFKFQHVITSLPAIRWSGHSGDTHFFNL